jgi:hypothetical protein
VRCGADPENLAAQQIRDAAMLQARNYWPRRSGEPFSEQPSSADGRALRVCAPKRSSPCAVNLWIQPAPVSAAVTIDKRHQEEKIDAFERRGNYRKRRRPYAVEAGKRREVFDE